MNDFIEEFETTEFSNNNFAIIGRILFIATKYELVFRGYFNGLACKYLRFFVKEVEEFSKIEITKDLVLNCEKVLEKTSKMSFHKVITIFFDKIINKAIPSNQIKDLFKNAKETRNFIAHELCKISIEETKKDSFREYLQKELENQLKQMIECTLIMDNCINEFNSDSTLIDINSEINKIYDWIVNI